MIAAKETGRDVVGGFSGVTHAMKINDEAMALVMDQLARGLYSKPKQAVVREYSTNARDAHVQAGNAHQAIIVRLPTSMKPLLTIQDFGPGLTEQEIGEIYSQYGASTKRQSNEFNGMLGFGCKAAFAVGNQFTVASVKNGKRIQVAVTRNEDGGGEMIVADETPTSDPNGTIVSIPASVNDRYDDVVQEFYHWWPEGTVEVYKGAERVKINHFDASAESVMDLGDGIYIVAHDRYGYRNNDRDDVVVMGGVAYPHRFETGLDRYNHTLVVFAPMGSVSFQSSREALRLDGHTKRFITETETKFRNALIKTMQTKIDAAATRADACKVVHDWRSVVPANVVPTDGWKYKGEAIPLNIQPGGDPSNPNPVKTAPLKRSGHHNYHRKVHGGLGIEHFVDTLWVEGYTAEKFTASHAQKLRKYVADNKLEDKTGNGFVLIAAIPAEARPWLQRVVTWDTIKAVKLPRDVATRQAQGLSYRIPGSYDLYTTHAYTATTNNNPVVVERNAGVPAEKFRHWTEPLFWYNGNLYNGRYVWEALKAVHPSATLVCMPAGRIDKFCRDFPGALKAEDAIKAGYDAWAATPTVKDSLMALAIQRDYWTRYLDQFDENRFDDPDLKRYTRLCKVDTDTIHAQNRVFMSVLGRHLALPEVKDPRERYPLLDTDHPDHSYFYCNAVYAARKNGASI